MFEILGPPLWGSFFAIPLIKRTALSVFSPSHHLLIVDGESNKTFCGQSIPQEFESQTSSLSMMIQLDNNDEKHNGFEDVDRVPNRVIVT